MGKGRLVMKEPRTEKLVQELRDTVERLNRLDKLLQQSRVSYDLGRARRDESFTLENVVQRVEY
jgi:hypothetical protein